MTFNKEEMEILKQYEEYFFTATKAKYCRYPGKSALETIHRIFVSATKSNVRLNTGCGHCIFTLVRDCGVRYFADKAELEALAAKEVKAEDIPVKTEEKVPVKTKTRKVKK